MERETADERRRRKTMAHTPAQGQGLRQCLQAGRIAYSLTHKAQSPGLAERSREGPHTIIFRYETENVQMRTAAT
jgi:hypothetical protein